MNKSILTYAGAALMFLGGWSNAFAQGTAFTYQGRLSDGSNPANGLYEISFALYDAVTHGNPVGGPLTNAPTAVSNGLFTVTLDFGAAAFTGAERWLEIGVRTNGGGAFTNLTPRQQITSTPYAVQALGAGSAASYTGAITDGQLSGNIARLNGSNEFSGPVQLSHSNNVVNGSFAGNGAGVTNVGLDTLNAFGAISWPGSFALASVLAAGSNCASVATADLNGDGKLDLACANSGDDTVSVFVNNGGGAFAAASLLAVGNRPAAVAATDVNGDAKPDLISANSFGNTLSILTNDGGGGFALASTPAVGTYPNSVVAADVNGDGKTDLMCANYVDNTLSVLTNDGSGGFALASSPGVGNMPYSVTAADVNGDGKADLTCVNAGDNTLSVVTNDGQGGFALASSPGVGTLPVGLTAADVNGDSKVDLISANNGLPGTLSVMTNDGSGGFTLASSLAGGGNPSTVKATDVNGDVRLDLICANNSNGTLSVFTNDGSGGFALASSPGAGSFTVSIAAADVNGDGRADLISASFFANTLSVLINSPTFRGTFNGNGAGLLPLNTNVPLLNADQTFSGANTFSNAANSFAGNGAGLRSLNATNLASGTVPDARLSANVALRNANQTFTGANTMNNAGNSFSGNGSGLTSLNASSLSGGTLPDARLSANVAMLNANQTFSGAQALTNAANVVSGNGAGLTSLNASTLASGTVADARLSANVALRGANQTFTGANTLNNAGNSFTGAGSGLTALNASSLASGTVADGRLSANVALLNGFQTFTGFPMFNVASGAPFAVGSTSRVANLNADLLDGLTGQDYATDASVVSALSNKVTKAGDTMSGTLGITVPASTQGLSVQGNRSGTFANAIVYLNNSNAAAASPALRLGVAGGTADGVLHLTGSGTGKLASFNGAGGEVASMTTNGSMAFHTNAALSFGNGTRQMLNLWSNQYALGVQSSTLYYRTALNGGFAWFEGGVHNNAQNNPGAGGVANMTLDSTGDLTVLGSMNATAFNVTSDRNAKTDFEPVNVRDVLDKVAALPLRKWVYTNSPAIRHVGPMAQDFHASFGLGESERTIATVDADGVALAAIQGLNAKLREELQARDERIRKLEQRLEALAAALAVSAREP